MNKKAWIGVAVAVLLVLLVVGTLIFLLPSRSRDRALKIGAILPLTGDSATYGTALKKGMDLALELDKQGGIDGRPLTIIYEDDAGKPATGVSAFTKLVSADSVPMVIGAMFSAVTLAIAPVAERDRVVLLSPTSSAVELTKAGDYIFRIYPSDTYDGIFLADFASTSLKARAVATIHLQVASISAITQVFRHEFESRGGRITVSEAYQEGDTDFRSQLLKASRDNPDLIFIPGYLKEMATLLRQAKELGLGARFLTISTFYDPKILELAGNAAEGVLFSPPAFDPKSTSPEMQRFVSAFQSKFGAEPDILAGYGYDAVNVAAVGLGRGGATPDDIKRNLYGIRDYPGVTGKTTFDSNGDVTKELRMLQVRNGQFTPYR